jgi:hypothetical protein
MTLAETTRSRTRHRRSAAELDVLKLFRIGVWLAFCVLALLTTLRG